MGIVHVFVLSGLISSVDIISQSGPLHGFLHDSTIYGPVTKNQMSIVKKKLRKAYGKLMNEWLHRKVADAQRPSGS